ncbi:MAG: LysR family transcriptional regulator [Rhizobiaceae bacterium]|nr:LysR family transcriptional regulator [Rhizobiaceae bacterium]
MNLRDLQYVEAIALHRNFSRAAHACNVSQPALSSQIKKLEQELGVALFERRTSDIQLTEFGTRAVESAKQILKQTDVIREMAMEYRDVEALPFKIGMTPTLAPYLTKYFRDMLLEIFPKMRVVLVEDKPFELAQKVERQEIDIALIARNSHELIYGGLKQKALDFTSIWLEPIYLGVRKGHVLAERSSIKAREIPAELLIRFNVPFGYDLEKDLPDVSGRIEEHTGFDVSSARFETVCRHISHSNHCTIINAIAADQFTQDNWGLEFIEFEDEGNMRDLGIISRPGYTRLSVLEGMGEYVNRTPPGGVIPTYQKS